MLLWVVRPAKNGKMFNKTIIISITFSSFPFAMPIGFNLRIACFLIFYLTAGFLPLLFHRAALAKLAILWTW